MKTIKFLLQYITLLASINVNAQTTLDTLRDKAVNNQNPEKWNMELFKSDQKWLKKDKSKPMRSSAFPVEIFEYYVFQSIFNFNIGEENIQELLSEKM